MNTLSEFKHPVAFFSNGLGDTILALPALRALSTLFPGLLTLVCAVGGPKLLFSELRTRKTVAVAMTRNVPDWTREFNVNEVVRRVSNCDFFLSLVPWHSTSLQDLLERLHPPSSIGFFDQYKISIPRDFTKHTADLSFEIPRRLDASLRFEDYCSPPQLSRQSAQVAAKVRALIPSSHKILAVHADTGVNKMWPQERFVQVLNTFLDGHPDFVCILVGSAPQLLDRGRHQDRIIPLYGLALDASMRMVELADIFLGVDSSILHAADFFRIPSVGLFGETNPNEFGFRVTPMAIVCKGKSMDAIQPQQVLGAMEAILARRPHQKLRSD